MSRFTAGEKTGLRVKEDKTGCRPYALIGKIVKIADGPVEAMKRVIDRPMFAHLKQG